MQVILFFSVYIIPGLCTDLQSLIPPIFPHSGQGHMLKESLIYIVSCHPLRFPDFMTLWCPSLQTRKKWKHHKVNVKKICQSSTVTFSMAQSCRVPVRLTECHRTHLHSLGMRVSGVCSKFQCVDCYLRL